MDAAPQSSDLALSSSDKVAIGLGAFCGAMIGAKLPFAIADWEGLRSGAVWFSNGKTIVVGIVGSVLRCRSDEVGDGHSREDRRFVRCASGRFSSHRTAELFGCWLLLWNTD